MRHLLLAFLLLLPMRLHAANVNIVTVQDRVIISVQFDTKASPMAVWNVLTNYERIPTFVKQMEVSKVLDRKGNDLTLEQVVVNNVYGLKKRNKVVFKVHEQPYSKITFVGYNSNGVQTCSGFWKVDNHSNTISVNYALKFEPKGLRFKYFSKSIVLKTTQDIIENIEAEIDRRK